MPIRVQRSELCGKVTQLSRDSTELLPELCAPTTTNRGTASSTLSEAAAGRATAHQGAARAVGQSSSARDAPDGANAM